MRDILNRFEKHLEEQFPATVGHIPIRNFFTTIRNLYSRMADFNLSAIAASKIASSTHSLVVDYNKEELEWLSGVLKTPWDENPKERLLMVSPEDDSAKCPSCDGELVYHGVVTLTQELRSGWGRYDPLYRCPHCKIRVRVVCSA